MDKKVSQLKREAKDKLKGRWGDAVLLNLVPSLIQIVAFLTIGILALLVFVLMGNNGESEGLFQIYSLGGIFGTIFFIGGSSPIIVSIIFTFIATGIYFTFLDVIRKGDRQKMSIKSAFRLFNGRDFVPILIINVLSYLFCLFWSFLFVVPGIVKKYAYSQANFIYKDLATHEDPSQISGTSIITESRKLMDGNKGRLFWLDISFIGWYIVGVCTLGIAFIWINPYINATRAAFYADLAKDKYLTESLNQTSDNDIEWSTF